MVVRSCTKFFTGLSWERYVWLVEYTRGFDSRAWPRADVETRLCKGSLYDARVTSGLFVISE